MDEPVVELGGTEWTLVEVVGEPVELDGARLTLFQGDEAVAKLEAGARPKDTAVG
jgi:hypothetical protein